MIRPVFTELALFLAPFAVYAIFLWATRSGMLEIENWALGRVLWLLVASLTLMAGSFVVLAQFGGAPPNSTYIPAHVEDGKLIPGEDR
jgi:hypothetical protein